MDNLLYRISGKLLALLCCVCVVGIAQLSAENADEYPDDFFEPVNNDPEPQPQQPQPSGPPMLGIQMTPPPTHAQQQNGTNPDQGVYVRRVFPNTAADEMGLRPGDIILSVNGTEIDSMSRLRDVVNQSKVGDGVNVLVTRNGELTHYDGQFREWLDNVARRRLDDQAEQRYRDMQKRRAERRLEEANQQQQAIKEQLEAHKQAFDELSYDQRLAKSLGHSPDFALPPIKLSGTDFSFHWQVDVDSNTLSAADNDTGVVSASEQMLLLSALAPVFELRYAFDVNNNEL